MSLSSSPSPLPKFPFLIADAAFIAAAWFIADQARHPMGSATLVAVVVCVVAAAICGAIPFLADYARRQDAALDERQRSLEALSRTVATAAEQISIAAGGLHEITELAQRNLAEAQKMPQRLAEQISEIEAKFGASRDEDREELERELATLRASESERLEATAQKIARAASDWAKAESSGLRHVVAAKTFIAELEQKTAELKAVLSGAPADATDAPRPASRKRSTPAPVTAFPTSVNVAPPPPADPTSSEGSVAEAAKAFGLGQRTDTKPLEGSATEQSDEVGSANGAPATQRSDDFEAYGVTEATLTSAPSEAAATAAVIRGEPVEADHADIEEAPPPAAEAAAEPAPAPKPKRVAKKPLVEQEVIPGFELPDETSQMFPEEGAPAAASSADGATRLIVTAYIGIGNRLFIRGEGPGLSWDEGVPLQFVSIGKWRWETPNATEAVRFKLYKNDREECTALRTDRIEAGQQQELTAGF